jgi:hypothetical protein
MRTSVSGLDEALDRVSALDFEPPVRFVNHAPMACEVLETLGFEAVFDEWVRRFEASMVEAVRPVVPRWLSDFEWEGLLGDRRILPEWVGYFEWAIADEGWPSVVEVWVPRLMPGLAAALFHGVIRTSHAVRAIERADTPSRRTELARALGNWATWFSVDRSVEETESAGVGDPARDAAAVAADAARFYVTSPTILHLHGVTGAMAVELLAGHIAPGDGASAVARLHAECRSLYRGTTPMAEGEGPGVWDDDVADAASRSYDPHQVKLVEACRRGFGITGDVGFIVAAETATSTRQG